jgi:hypothetical protein
MDIKIGDYVEKWVIDESLESSGFVIQLLGERVWYQELNTKEIFCNKYDDLLVMHVPENMSKIEFFHSKWGDS